MVLFLYFITFMFPIVALPINFLMILLNKNKKIHYMIQNSFSLAVFSFCWRPTATYDLYGWHLASINLSKIKFSYFIEYLFSNGEPLNNILKYLAGISGNVNYLQFAVVLMGFLILNNLINKMVKKFNLSSLEFSVLYILTVTSLLLVNFISGLFFYFASIILCNGIFLIYEDKKKWGLFLLFVSFLIHSSMFFPISMFLIYYFLCNSKINFRTIVISIVIASSISYIVPIFIEEIKNPLFNEIGEMYNSYFQQTTFNSMNSGFFLLFNIIEYLPIILVGILHNNIKKMPGFAIVIGISSIIISIKAPIFIRYIYLANLTFLPHYCDFFREAKETLNYISSKIVTIIIFLTIILATIYQVKLLNDINFLKIIFDNFYKIIFIIFGQ